MFKNCVYQKNYRADCSGGKAVEKNQLSDFFNEAKRNHEKPVVRRNYSPKKFTDFLLLTVFQNCIFASALIE